MAAITVDFTQQIGKIKPVHSVGQPPFSGANFSMFSYLKEANIPMSRLHDVGMVYGFRYVDIPFLFRDFDADPSDPASYDFAFTDRLITALIENGVEPFFRLGVSIENYADIKAFFIDPPKDNLKWAKICEGVIRHYTEGWADGFHYNIRYWEIWNEPDNFEEIELNHMWRGAKEQYYELYDVAASYLKEKFPHLKIGGYASCGFCGIDGQSVAAANSSSRFEYFLEFFNGFIDYIRAHHSPLDFFSWHSYCSIERTMNHAQYCRQRLDEAGYTETEHTCNEWNFQPELRGTAQHAALTTGMILAMQNSSLDSAMFYDARWGTSIYGSLFNPLTKEPFPAYYGFKGFGELYRLGTQVTASCDQPDVYAVAAVGENEGRVLIANTGDPTPLTLHLNGQTVKACKVIDENRTFEDCDLPQTLGQNTVLYLETGV